MLDNKLHSCYVLAVGMLAVCELFGQDRHVLTQPTDLYCGPRCVARIFEKHSVDFHWDELVSECQPTVASGSSLLALQGAIVSRGLSCPRRIVNNISDLRGAGILYLPPEKKSTNSMGHFLVHERSKAGELVIWPTFSEAEQEYLAYRLENERRIYTLSVFDPQQPLKSSFYWKFRNQGFVFFVASASVFGFTSLFLHYRGKYVSTNFV